MKKSVLIAVMVVMVVASGVSYGATKNTAANTANVEKMMNAGLEAAADQAAKDQDKAQWGDLFRHRKTILKEIRKQQPTCTKAVNLGRYSTVQVLHTWGEYVTDRFYLVEANAADKVYYFQVVVREHLTLIEHKWSMQEFIHVHPLSIQAVEKAKETIK